MITEERYRKDIGDIVSRKQLTEVQEYYNLGKYDKIIDILSGYRNSYLGSYDKMITTGNYDKMNIGQIRTYTQHLRVYNQSIEFLKQQITNDRKRVQKSSSG